MRCILHLYGYLISGLFPQIIPLNHDVASTLGSGMKDEIL